MRALWVFVVVLGLLYLAIWGVVTQSNENKPNSTPADLNQSPRSLAPGEQLSEIARGDVLSRVDPKASTKVISIKPKRLAGENLDEVGLTEPTGTVGFEIIIAALVGEKEVSRFKYHAAPPTKTVFKGAVNP